MVYWGNELFAWKNGVTGIGEGQMNNLIAAQSSVLIFEGTETVSSVGDGTTEYNLSLSDQYDLVTIPSSNNTIGRIELEIKKYGAGSDLTLQIIKGLPTNPTEIVKEIIYPAKLFDDGYISLPVDISDISGGHWIVLKQAGDSTNHLRWVGEADQDETKHFKVFANTTDSIVLRHAIHGGNAMTRLDYNTNGLIKEIWRWLPAPDNTFPICERIVPTYSGNIAVRWEVD